MSQPQNAQRILTYVKYQKLFLDQGIIVAQNPVYTSFQDLKFNEEYQLQRSQLSSSSTKLEQDYTQKLDLDLIMIDFQQASYLFKCNNQGQILSSSIQIKQQFQNIFVDDYKVSIQKLAYVSQKQLLFFLDKNKNVSTIQFFGNKKQEYKTNIQQQVDFLIASSDKKSVLLINNEKKFIIYNEDSTSKNPQFCLEVNEEYHNLLNEGNEQILSSIQSVDYFQQDGVYQFYLASQQFLYKLKYEKQNDYINLDLIIKIDQSQGKVQKIVAINLGKKFDFELVVVQQKSVDLYKLTNNLSVKNIWKCRDQSSKLAFDYSFQIRDNQLYHLVQLVSSILVNQNEFNQQQYTKSFMYIKQE